MQFNKSQEVAILHRSGPALVLAGPGSGKTAVITYRIRELIHSGIPPESILVITFTRAAAGEMRERFQKLCDGTFLPVTFGTFHSIFFSILCKEVGLNQNSIISDNARYRILKDILIQTSKKYDDEPGMVSAVLDEISSIKSIGGLSSPYQAKTCSNEEFFAIFDAYQKALARERLVDFDDMLLMTKRLFSRRADVLRAWRKKYQYILIDEFQDVNQVQYDIVKLLAYPKNNLFVVGDDDQSIYGFRGSSPKFMLGFGNDFPSAKRIILNVNYRSRKEIVDMASRLISHNKNRYEKKVTAARGETNNPQEKFLIFKNVHEENDYIVGKIRELFASGMPYSEMTALFRTNRSYRALAERLSKENIPFLVDSKPVNIYEHWIAKDLFSYMRILNGGRAREDFLRVINRPSRYVKREVFRDKFVDLPGIIRELELARNDTASESGLRVSEEVIYELKRLLLHTVRVEGFAPFALISYIRKVIRYDDYLREYARKINMKPDELLSIADEIQEAALAHSDVAEWFSWIEKYGKEVFCFISDRGVKENKDAVRLMSMHRSKGLEFKVVFIPDANEGITPYSKAKHEYELEEERRLFYVAMTRAKTHLYMTSSMLKFNKNYQPSRFLYEARESDYSI